MNPELGNSLAQAKGNHVLNGTSDNQVEKQSSEQKGLTEQQLGSTNISINNMSEKKLNALSSKTTDMDGQLHKNSYHSEAVEASESEVIDLNAEKVTGNKIVGESNQNHSTSILDKIFGTAITGGGPSSFIEVIMISNGTFLMPFLCSYYVDKYEKISVILIHYQCQSNPSIFFFKTKFSGFFNE